MNSTSEPTNPAVSVLIDNCVDTHTDRAVGAEFTKQLDWGGRTHEFKIAAIEIEPALPKKHAWVQSQIDCLPTIGRLARQKIVSIFTYPELQLETFRRPGCVWPGLTDEFSDIEYRNANAAVERSRLFSAAIQEYASKDAVIRFVDFLLRGGARLVLESRVVSARFTAFELANLSKIERLHAICDGLAPQHYPDAMHFWTAATNDLDYFLTADRKFMRILAANKKVQERTKAISPSDLLAALGVTSLDAPRLLPGEKYDLFGKLVDSKS